MKNRIFKLLLGTFVIATLLSCNTVSSKDNSVNNKNQVSKKEWITAVVYRNNQRFEAKVIDNLLWLDNDDFMSLNAGSGRSEEWKATCFATKGDTIVYRKLGNNRFEIKEFKPFDR